MCVFRLNHLAAEGTHGGKRDPVKGTGFTCCGKLGEGYGLQPVHKLAWNQLGFSP